MNQEECRCYRFGYSGYNFLCINKSVYTQSELLPDGIIREIECDKDDKWMKVKEREENSNVWNEIGLSDLNKGVTIDLSENGDRWEGDSLKGVPFGYGCFYNSENQLIYSGFMFQDFKVCYGVELYGDVCLVEYEGGFYKGMRYGYGKLYDKKNALVYEGEWYNNNPLQLNRIHIERELKEEDIHFGLEEIVIGNDCNCNLSSIRLLDLYYLTKLTIGNNCFKSIEILILNCKLFHFSNKIDLPKLSIFTIGKESFSKTKTLLLSSIF